MVVAAKWTGTDADRRDMEKFQLDQVLRVSESFDKLVAPLPSPNDPSEILADWPCLASLQPCFALGRLYFRNSPLDSAGCSDG